LFGANRPKALVQKALQATRSRLKFNLRELAEAVARYISNDPPLDDLGKIPAWQGILERTIVVSVAAFSKTIAPAGVFFASLAGPK
jgi:hypothetical protein